MDKRKTTLIKKDSKKGTTRPINDMENANHADKRKE